MSRQRDHPDPPTGGTPTGGTPTGGTPTGGTLSADERVELERLRGEVERLRASAAGRAGRAGACPPVPGRARRWGRTFATVLLIGLGCVLAPLSVTSVWARGEVTDANRYVDTVAPLAKDPAVQNAVTADITRAVFTYIDVRGLTTRAFAALAEKGSLPPAIATQLAALAVPVSNGVQNFAEDEVRKVVQSEVFAQAWVEANRAAHEQLVAALTGSGDGSVTIEGTSVRVDLAPFVRVVKEKLVSSGFELAARVPEVHTQFVVFESAGVQKVQRGFDLLNRLGFWMPFICLALVGLGVYVARNHRLAFIGAGLGVALAMLVTGVALAVVRSAYLDSVPEDRLPADAAAVLYDTLVRYLREAVRAGAVLGLLVASGAFLTGPSVTATKVRQLFVAGIAAVRHAGESAGLRMEGVTRWVAPRATILRAGAVAAAFGVLLLYTYRTPALVAWLTVSVLAALFVIQLLATPPGAQPGKA